MHTGICSESQGVGGGSEPYAVKNRVWPGFSPYVVEKTAGGGGVSDHGFLYYHGFFYSIYLCMYCVLCMYSACFALSFSLSLSQMCACALLLDCASCHAERERKTLPGRVRPVPAAVSLMREKSRPGRGAPRRLSVLAKAGGTSPTKITKISS
jgi:hypothetical protein